MGPIGPITNGAAAVRLTLRTLLAYLDDTLEPHEIKEIGQKVAESDAAQELIARIKQVTRRRRLTTPPPGGANAKFDANTIAEYLDNELSGDLVAELEKTCLESDVHLAEVASCHQILTLVLGEPALVPPTARERMYGLVKGREAIPFRKARARDGAGEGEPAERLTDDPLLPGLPASRGWLLWVLPVAAVLVLAALAVAVWQALPDTRPNPVVANKNNNPPPPPPPQDDNKATPAQPADVPTPKTLTGKVVKFEEGKLTLTGADDKEMTVTVPASAKVTIDGKEGKLDGVSAESSVTITQVGDAVTVVEAVSPERKLTGKAVKVEGDRLTLRGADDKETVVTVPPSAKVFLDGKEAKLDAIGPDSAVTVTQVGDAVVRVDAATDDRPKPASTVRASAGRYAMPPNKGEGSILLQRQANQAGWKRLVPGRSEVFTTDDLVSLPGYASEVDLGPDGGTRLLLLGHVPEFTPTSPDPRVSFQILDFLLESAVRLYQPEAGFDADLTLARGRIYLSNHKAPVKDKEQPVKVRLRFAGEVWDLTLLDPDTEVGVDLLQGYTADTNYRDGEPPLQELYLTVLAGRASIKIESREYSNKPAPVVAHWDNKGKGASEPQPIDPRAMSFVRIVWSQSPPVGATQQEQDTIAKMREALNSLSLLMTEKKAVDATLLEARQKDEQPMLRLLAVYSFGAIDAADRLLDVLCTDENPAHAPDRNAAIFTLRRWIGRDAKNGAQLYDEGKETGLLLAQRYHYRGTDANTILVLLHDFPPADARKQATFDELTSLLRSTQLPIRELAYWHLRNLSAGARVQLPPYNAAWGADEREPAVQAWKALIGKELPPPAPQAAPPGQ